MIDNPYTYTVEKLTTALSVIVSHPGDARERLNDAFLCFHTLQERDFPPNLQEKWRQIIKEMTKYGPLLNHKGEAYRGSVENTMHHIRKRTASKIIKEIYKLYWAVSENEEYC